RKAMAGDAQAQYHVGQANIQAKRPVFRQAAMWYQKAADQGLANAQYELGVLFQSGKGVEQDFAKASAWYRKAADQGLAGAQLNWDCSSITATGFRRTMPRRPAGTVRRRCKVCPRPSTTLAPSMSVASACRRITRRQRISTARQPTKEMHRRSSTWPCSMTTAT